MYQISCSNPNCSYTISWFSKSSTHSFPTPIPSLTPSPSSPTPSFLQSIKQVIPFASIMEGGAIHIMTTSVKRIDEMEFDYELLVVLVQCLINQILYLEKRCVTFIGFELADIVSIGGGKYFFIANCSNLTSYDLVLPFVKPTFTTPEIKNLVKLPAQLSPFTARYSLGVLIISLLGGSMEIIKYTKLYWFLHRCINSTSNFALV
jgi:hypothetical protein